MGWTRQAAMLWGVLSVAACGSTPLDAPSGSDAASPDAKSSDDDVSQRDAAPDGWAPVDANADCDKTELACCADYELEVNDTLASAWEIPFELFPDVNCYQLIGAVLCPADDVDVYAVTQAPGERMQVRVTPKDGPLTLDLLTDDGEILVSMAPSASPLEATWLASTAEKTRIQIASPTGAPAGYDLLVDLRVPGEGVDCSAW